jgi:hypothetical protein
MIEEEPHLFIALGEVSQLCIFLYLLPSTAQEG